MQRNHLAQGTACATNGRFYATEAVRFQVDKALVLAGDLPKLAALRPGCASVSALPLFDAKRFARDFEANCG